MSNQSYLSEKKPAAATQAYSLFDKIYNLICCVFPERKAEFFANIKNLIGQRADVFFLITEELAQIGFLDDVERAYHQTILACLREFLQYNRDLRSGEKVARLVAKFAELLDDDALVYTELTHELFERLTTCFKGERIDPKTVEGDLHRCPTTSKP